MQKQLDRFNGHRNTDKTPKFMEKSNLEDLLNLQSKMRAHDKALCALKEWKMIRDINLAWESLEKA